MNNYSIFYRGRFVGLVQAYDSATALLVAEDAFGKARDYVVTIIRPAQETAA